MSEKLLWNRLKDIVRGQSLPGRWERVENGVVDGMPDANFCVLGNEGWIELKHGKIPAKKDTIVFKSQRGLTQEQVNWHFNQTKNGGKSWVLVQLDARFFAIPGNFADEINQYSMVEMVNWEVKLKEFMLGLCNEFDAVSYKSSS